MMAGCSEHKKIIDFDLPKYEPKLVVICGVGPLSGGQAILGWSRPLNGHEGTVPRLPNLDIYLLANNQRVQKFDPENYLTGFFNLNPDRIDWVVGTEYAIEIYFPETRNSVFSQSVRLPPIPTVANVKVSYDTDHLDWYNVNYSILATFGNVGAKYTKFVLNDSSGNPIEKIGLTSYLLSGAQSVNNGQVLQQDYVAHFSRILWRENENTELASSAVLRVAYFSIDLARFKKEADELGSFGEAIYQTVKPLYGNIDGVVGVFGLYSELDTVFTVSGK